MKDFATVDFVYPSTRYSGSKRQLLSWIWENTKELKFTSVLDLFGGTGSVSLMFKRYGKKVFYNDLLQFNQIIGKAIIENRSVYVSDSDVENVLDFSKLSYPNFIQENFKGIFFLDEENEWLDKAITNIMRVTNEYKRAILLASLFQACLTKRPFNLFHRANLYLRVADVPRSFGNKTTWEKPFDSLLKRFIREYNRAIFDNGKDNLVIGGYDAFSAPSGVDLVYIDPPYFSLKSGGTNYLEFYHFLEGIASYSNWETRINGTKKKVKQINDIPEIDFWIRKKDIAKSLETVIRRFQDNIILLSYQADGIPSKDEIMSMLRKYKRKVKVFSKPHRYVLSKTAKEELLFIAT